MMNEPKTITLDRDECMNLLDALEEWHDVVGCKDCEVHRDEEHYHPDIEQKNMGLDYERYHELTKKLESVL